ncbi:hypothetical protein EJB05_26834, partial [Eragrostis curvula]
MSETAPQSWLDIPLEVADLIICRLPAHVDRVRFAAVCSQWRVAAREAALPPPLPLLTFRDGTVYSLPGSEPFHLPACEGYTSACGSWLVFSHEDGCFLKDPFSNTTVTLPSLYVGDELGSSWMENQNVKKLASFKEQSEQELGGLAVRRFEWLFAVRWARDDDDGTAPRPPSRSWTAPRRATAIHGARSWTAPRRASGDRQQLAAVSHREEGSWSWTALRRRPRTASR